ncbi:unnamed protein product [Protopolystoma xenopodis]|uniref:Uncharacterized protein n=1 Tax=Protopolystoma xenopodis TaxID=117903 RepID=A0A3S5CNS4_9PLAT|nr:unnamed protein product [Protopolystoma xenopodis]
MDTDIAGKAVSPHIHLIEEKKAKTDDDDDAFLCQKEADENALSGSTGSLETLTRVVSESVHILKPYGPTLMMLPNIYEVQPRSFTEYTELYVNSHLAVPDVQVTNTLSTVFGKLLTYKF